ncbi:MAG: hypothetical protein HUU25_01870 [Candidatus Sumerlaeia bacterium]|nr:hypothetical protein [Candidatus Sumerlaeia bacterium]
MRTLAIAALVTVPATLFTGCTAVSGGGTGALIGGLTGAGIGAIAGDPAAGALLGTGLGLAAGSLVGGANEDLARRQGWVYDDIWGARGHYAGQPVVYRQPVVYQQPVAYPQPIYAPPPPPVYCPPAYPATVSYSMFYHN